MFVGVTTLNPIFGYSSCAMPCPFDPDLRPDGIGDVTLLVRRMMELLLHNFRFRMRKQLSLLNILNRIDWMHRHIPYRTGP